MNRLCILVLSVMLPVVISYGHEVRGQPGDDGSQSLNQIPVVVQAQSKILDNQLIEAVWENNTTLVKDLIRKGANVEALLDEKTDGRTALLVAVQNCCFEAAQLLLQQGANPNATFETGGSGLHYAAATGDTKMIELLLKHGANPLLKSSSGMTALQEAQNAGKREAIQILKASDAKSEDISFDKIESFIVQTLKGRGIKVFSVRTYPNDYGGKKSYTLEIIYEDRTPTGKEQNFVRVIATGFLVSETFNITVRGVEAIAAHTNEDTSRPDKWRAESCYYTHESTEPFFRKWFFVEMGQPCSNQESARFEEWIEKEWRLDQYDPNWSAKPHCRK